MKKNVNIIGGGCAGFSLAKNLRNNKNLRIKIYDKDHNHEHYWGFWNFNIVKDAFNLSEKNWNKWKIISSNKEKTFFSSKHAYCALMRNRWINYCKKLCKDAKVSIINKRITENDNRLYLGKKEIAGDMIFDSRQPKNEKNVMLQHFYGLTVVSNRKVFDDSTAILMDFRWGL